MASSFEDAMRMMRILRSEKTAWIAGATAVAILAAAAYWLVGWLGVGLLGLIGLSVSNQVDLHGGHAAADFAHGKSIITGYARQLDEARAAASSPEQRMAAAAEREKRSNTVYLTNTVFIALIALGFGLFAIHEVP